MCASHVCTPRAFLARPCPPLHGYGHLGAGSLEPFKRVLNVPTERINSRRWPSVTHRQAGRRRTALVAASAPSSHGADGSSTGDEAPFSVELLLATARFVHLERYREELKYIYEHDAPPLDLTRCALLICNHAFPQLDHRDYYERLEMLSACVASRVIGMMEDGYNRPLFAGLDPSNRMHQLYAVAAINHALFVEEGFCMNGADPHDPNNSYLSELLDKKQGNQYTLLILYIHIAEALGLPVTLVGTSDRMMLQLGDTNILTCSTSERRPSYDAAAAMKTTGNSSNGSSSRSNSIGCNSSLEEMVGVEELLPAVFREESSATEAATAEGGSWLNGLCAEGLGAVQLYKQLELLGDPSSMSSTSSSSSSSGSPAAFCAAVAALEGAVLLIDVTQQGKLYCWWPGEPQQYSFGTEGTWGSTGSVAAAAPVAQQGGGLGQMEMDSLTREVGCHGGVEEEDGGSLVGLGAWGRVKQQWEADARKRNSWKALYGSGALDWPQHVAETDGEDGSSNSSDMLMSEGGSGHGAVAEVRSSLVHRSATDGLDLLEDRQGEGLTVGHVAEQPTPSTPTAWDVAAEVGLDNEDNSSRRRNSSEGELLVSPLSSEQLLQLGALQPVSHRMLLMQLLSAQKLPFMMMGRTEDALATIRYMRATDPFSLPDLRDEGLCLYDLGRWEEAGQLMREYLALAPGAADADMVEEVLQQLDLRIALSQAEAYKRRRKRWS